jgi:hypothetical protein
LVAEVGVVGHLRCGVRGRVVVLLIFGERGGVLAEQLLAISVVCVDHIDAGRAAGRCLSWAHAGLVAWEPIWTRVSKVTEPGDAYETYKAEYPGHMVRLVEAYSLACHVEMCIPDLQMRVYLEFSPRRGVVSFHHSSYHRTC